LPNRLRELQPIDSLGNISESNSKLFGDTKNRNTYLHADELPLFCVDLKVFGHPTHLVLIPTHLVMTPTDQEATREK
jgi:hypothetical protein